MLLLLPPAPFIEVGCWFGLLSLLRVTLCGVYRPGGSAHNFYLRARCREFSKQGKERKLAENLWYAVWHTCSFCLGLAVLLNESWFRELVRSRSLDLYWSANSASPRGFPHQTFSTPLLSWYKLEIAFWLSCAAFLAYEKKRDDFLAMLIHHIATSVAIVGSYATGHILIGAVVLLLHDTADICLYSAKMLHYSNVRGGIVDAVFVLFVLVFVFSRLVLFPWLCVRAGLTKVMYSSHGQQHLLADAPGGRVLPLMLCTLQLLHVYWMGLIAKMIYRTICGTRVSQDGDIRSDIESEEEKQQQQMQQRRQAKSGRRARRRSGIPASRENAPAPHENASRKDRSLKAYKFD